MRCGALLAAMLATLGMLTACEPEAGSEPVGRTAIGGTEVVRAARADTPRPASSACREVTYEGTPLVHCIADPARHRIAMELGPDDGAPYRSLPAMAQGRTAGDAPLAFAVNGGMFDEAGEPIGYYVEDGCRLEELNRADGPGNFHLKPNGVFFGSNGEWRVLPADTFYATVGERPEFGTQSGPMLVVDGALHPRIAEDGPSKAIRNGVGVDGEGRAHFVLAREPLSFGRLARFFRDELETGNALFLDGNVSALLEPDGRSIGVAPIGPMIVVTRRQEPGA